MARERSGILGRWGAIAIPTILSWFGRGFEKEAKGGGERGAEGRKPKSRVGMYGVVLACVLVVVVLSWGSLQKKEENVPSTYRDKFNGYFNVVPGTPVIPEKQGKLSLELIEAMNDSSPDDKLRIIVQSDSIINSPEVNQINEIGTEVLVVKERMVIARATKEQIEIISKYEWVSLIGLDVLGEAQSPLFSMRIQIGIIFAIAFVMYLKNKKGGKK